MKALKTAFNVAAMATGGALTVWSGIGLAVGGWKSDLDMGGVDLTLLGVAFCSAGAGLMFAGYRGITKAAKASQDKNDGQGPQPPAP
ncbi:MAG: hypothetical protein KKA05_04620 [Alphaproteobacteria bacterium]|nr:hypothetical protein [Alphaproteobacteria bacterium]